MKTSQFDLCPIFKIKLLDVRVTLKRKFNIVSVETGETVLVCDRTLYNLAGSGGYHRREIYCYLPDTLAAHPDPKPDFKIRFARGDRWGATNFSPFLGTYFVLDESEQELGMIVVDTAAKLPFLIDDLEIAAWAKDKQLSAVLYFDNNIKRIAVRTLTGDPISPQPFMDYNEINVAGIRNLFPHNVVSLTMGMLAHSIWATYHNPEGQGSLFEAIYRHLRRFKPSWTRISKAE